LLRETSTFTKCKMTGARIIPGMPMSFSPMTRPRSVNHIGLLIRLPMILEFRNYSPLCRITRNIRAAKAIWGLMVRPIPTMSVLLKRLPTMGNMPKRKVSPITTVTNG